MGKVYVADVIVILPNKRQVVEKGVVMGDEMLTSSYTRNRIISQYCDRKTAKYKDYLEKTKLMVMPETIREVKGINE
jgi:hypothetical protein